jgi:hypothetical protein
LEEKCVIDNMENGNEKGGRMYKRNNLGIITMESKIIMYVRILI